MRSLLLLILGCLLAWPMAADAASISRGPFIQQTSSSRALVVVHTDVAAAVEVSARTDSGTQSQASSSGTRRHVLELENLEPASDVTYEVRVDGAVAFGPATFRTPGKPDTEEGRQAVIGIIGDMGSGGPNERANVAQMAERGIDLLLTVGDNSYPKGAPEEWDPKFFGPFAPLLPYTTLMPTVGDHEYLTPGATGYLEAFELPEQPGGERYYSFDWGDVHVVSLDSNCLDPLDPEPIGCTAEGMMSWLADDLAASDAPWKIVTIHRPAVASGKYGISPEVAAGLIPLVEQHGVDLVVQGHNHFYERTWPLRGGEVVQRGYDDADGVVYVTSGGGGDWVYESPGSPPEWSGFRATDFQHLQVTVSGGTLTVDSVRPDGSILDSFTITKELPPITSEPDAGADDPPPSGGPDAGIGAPGDDEGEPPPVGCGAIPAAPLVGAALAWCLVLRIRAAQRRHH